MGWCRSNYCDSVGCLLSLSVCRRGLKDLLKVSLIIFNKSLQAVTFYRTQYSHRLVPINTNTYTAVVQTGLNHKWKAAVSPGGGGGLSVGRQVYCKNVICDTYGFVCVV
jgi:hypothetical protein